MQLGGAALGGAAGVATAGALGNTGANKPGAVTPIGTSTTAPLDPGVTLPNSNAAVRNDGQSAAQIAAANPQGNVFRADARTAATNPGEPNSRNLKYAVWLTCSTLLKLSMRTRKGIHILAEKSGISRFRHDACGPGHVSWVCLVICNCNGTEQVRRC